MVSEITTPLYSLAASMNPVESFRETFSTGFIDAVKEYSGVVISLTTVTAAILSGLAYMLFLRDTSIMARLDSIEKSVTTSFRSGEPETGSEGGDEVHGGPTEIRSGEPGTGFKAEDTERGGPTGGEVHGDIAEAK